MASVDISLPVPNQAQLLTLLARHRIRPSLRALGEPRALEIEVSNSSYGFCTVSLGATRVACRVSAEIVPPYEDRPFEGLFTIATEVSPMCSPAYVGDDAVLDEVTISRIIEKAVRRANALDLESLCIQAGAKCWSVRADVHFLNDDGNLIDAACIAVLTSLLHFRKQDLEVVNGQVVLYNEMQRDLVPLSVLHIPLCVTFSLFSGMDPEWRVKGGDAVVRAAAESSNVAGDDEEGESASKPRTERLEDVVLLDADAEEAPLALGTLTITVNSNRELCQVSKSGGLTLGPRALLQCTDRACEVVVGWTKQIKDVLAKDADSRRDLRAERVLRVVNDRSTE